MGLPAINSLANMEYMLYGGISGANTKCPSFANGYTTADFSKLNPYAQLGNPYFNYGSYNPVFSGLYGQPNSIYSGYNNLAPQTQNTAQTQQNVGFGASQTDIDTLANYYGKKMEPSESLMGAAFGGAAFGLVNNLRLVAHPINSATALMKTEKIFKDAGMNNPKSNLNKLFNNEETTRIAQDAYGQVHKLNGATCRKLGALKQKIDPNGSLYKSLKAELEAALKSGDKEAVAKVTEKIRIVTSQKTGWLANGLRKLVGKEAITAENLDKILQEKIGDGTWKAAYEKTLAEKTIKDVSLKGKFLNNLKKGGGVKGGLLFMGIEFLTSFGNIKSAFDKDTSTGMKQIGQTAVKGAGSAVGWAVGEAAGAALGAKIGASVGTAICPGLGTAIGAVAGLVGGSVGCWLMGKVTKGLVGEDVGAKVEIENMKKTAEGQLQLLQLTAQIADGDKELDSKTLQALNNVAKAYNVA